MILPNKYVSISESFLGLSALILEILKSNEMYADKIWEQFNKKYIDKNKLKNPPNYQKFIFVLEFMYMVGMINYTEKGGIYNENIKSENTK